MSNSGEVVRFPAWAVGADIVEMADMIAARDADDPFIWTEVRLANIDHAHQQADLLGHKLTEAEAEAEADRITDAIKAELARRGVVATDDDNGPGAA